MMPHTTCCAVNFRGCQSLRSLLKMFVRNSILCYVGNIIIFFFFPGHLFLHPSPPCLYFPLFYAQRLIEAQGWLCFNFWPRCKILFFFHSYCSNGSSRYLTHPRAALHIERQKFRLWMIFSKNCFTASYMRYFSSYKAYKMWLQIVTTVWYFKQNSLKTNVSFLFL